MMKQRQDNSRIGVLSLSVILGAGYLLLVRSFRFRRREANQELLQTENSDDPENARHVLLSISEYEFPMIYRMSLEFALFRTYAIPSISKLLQSTKQFQNVCGKRYDDTDLLLAELRENPFSSTRSIEALQRINAIHDMYKAQISNEDMLYVLSVFVLEPKKWIDKYEWRTLTPHEYQAIFIAWKNIGERMGIRNIPTTLSEFEQWSQAYEELEMKYADSNVVIAQATIALFLSLVPSFFHHLGHQIAYCLMDNRLRVAMGFPNETSPVLQQIIESVMTLRRFCLRYLSLPRLLSARRSPRLVDASGRLCPRFHVYERTYANGYETAKLGTAPPGKLMTNRPKWTKASEA